MASQEAYLEPVSAEAFIVIAAVSLLMFGAVISRATLIGTRRGGQLVNDLELAAGALQPTARLGRPSVAGAPPPRKITYRRDAHRAIQPPLLSCTVADVVTFVFLLSAVLVHTPPSNHLSFNGALAGDALYTFCATLVLIAGASCACASRRQLRPYNEGSFEWGALTALAICGLLLLCASVDLISVYLSLELQSLCLYVLAAYKRNSEFCAEAGLKYFVLGAFASGVLLFGCSLLYGLTGTLRFDELAVFLACSWSTADAAEQLGAAAGSGLAAAELLAGSDNSGGSAGTSVGVTLVVIGLLFKVAAAPFHLWAPDVYEGAPTSTTMLFAAVPKVAAFGALLRMAVCSLYDARVAFAGSSTNLYGPSYSGSSSPLGEGPVAASLPAAELAHHSGLVGEAASIWTYIVLVSAAVSMIVGALGALRQSRIKRLLAYSAIGQTGHLLLGVGCGSAEGAQAMLFSLALYSAAVLGVFAWVLTPVRRMFDHSTQGVKYLSDLCVLARTHPAAATAFALTLFSLAGVPPLAGFWGKYYLLFSVFSRGLYSAAVVAVVCTAIACVYYIRVVHLSHFASTPSKLMFGRPEKPNSLMIATAVGFVALVFVAPDIILLAAHRAAVVLSI